MEASQRTIKERIAQSEPGSVFTPKDFLDIAERGATDQALSRLVRAGELRRVARGLYSTPRKNPVLGIDVPPHLDAIAEALGRQTGSRVVASGAMAANRLGLSEQVPARPLYLTDGRSREVRVGRYVLQVKHVPPKELPPGSPMSAMVFQTLRYLGQDGITEKTINTISRALSPEQKETLLRDARYASDWMSPIVRRIVASPTGVTRG